MQLMINLRGAGYDEMQSAEVSQRAVLLSVELCCKGLAHLSIAEQLF